MALRYGLAALITVASVAAQAQQADDARPVDGAAPGLLRGATLRPGVGDGASEASATAQPDGTARKPLLIDAVAEEEARRAAGRQQRVRAQDPITTGSLARQDTPVPDEGVFGGDTTRDAPRGIRAGSFLIFPELTLRGGVTDNVSGSATGQDGAVYRVAPSVRVTSDWERHSYEARLSSSYLGNVEDPLDDRPTVEFSSTLRLDGYDETSLQGDLTYGLASEGSSTAEVAGGGGSRVLAHSIGGALSATREVGQFGARLRGSVDGNAYTGDGLAGMNRNNMVAGLGLRVGYAPRAPISPFVEGRILGRLYEDAPGRDALGYELRGGLAVDRGDKLRGEIAVGWHSEDLSGRAFKNLDGVLVEADLVWSPTRLTTVRLDGSTTFEASSLAGTSGSIIYGGGAHVAHSLSESLAVDVGGSVAYRDYQGLKLHETTISGTAGATYAVSSTAALQARYTYDRFVTSQAGGSYSANTIEAGVRLRR